MCGNVLVNRNYAQKADFPQEKFRRALLQCCCGQNATIHEWATLRFRDAE
jgi:hypothetical protein